MAETARLLAVSRILGKSGWSMQAHAHPFHEMLVFLAGRHRVAADGVELRSGAGDVVLFPPRTLHEEQTEGGERADWLCLSFECHGGQQDRPIQTHDSTGRVRLLGEWLLSERQSLSPTADRLRNALLGALLAEFLETFQVREHELIRRVRQYVREHLAGPVRLDDLARVAGFSRFHFVREFGRRTGRPPMADVRILRLDCARDLLVSSTLPLKSIAERCGLGDEHSLCRLFRRHFGVSPGSLRGYTRRRPGS